MKIHKLTATGVFVSAENHGKIKHIVYANASTDGHNAEITEADGITPVMSVSVGADGETVPLLNLDLTFAAGLNLTIIDSGEVYVVTEYEEEVVRSI